MKAYYDKKPSAVEPVGNGNHLPAEVGGGGGLGCGGRRLGFGGGKVGLSGGKLGFEGEGELAQHG